MTRHQAAAVLAGAALVVAWFALADAGRYALRAVAERNGAVTPSAPDTVAGLALMLGLETPAEPTPAEDFELPTLDGRMIRLVDLRGKVVLLNFWATWCPPCRAEMPAMEQVYRDLAPRGFVVVAVDYREGKALVEPFVKELGLTFPIALDTAGTVTDELFPNVGRLPTSYLIDRRGRMIARKVGFLEWDGAAARALFETLLAEPAAPS
jgi:thiol-disulfide isomerase/thioredoxin